MDKIKILWVDDEIDLLRPHIIFLEQKGYEVLTSNNGDDAIELIKTANESSNSFDAIIMDLTVPGGTGGKEAILKLGEIDSKVKVIVSSGYSNDPILSDYKRFGFSGVITKPYRIEELSDVLQRVICN